MGSRRFTGLLMPPAGRTVLPPKARIESSSETVFPREVSSKRQEKPNKVKKEGKELNQKEPTLGWTVNKQEGTFLCHQPYFFGNKNYFSRNNLSIQQENVLKWTAPVLSKSPGVLTFLSKMYGQLSWALPVFPARELSSGGILNVSAANVFPRACPKWTKKSGERGREQNWDFTSRFQTHIGGEMCIYKPCDAGSVHPLPPPEVMGQVEKSR